MFLGRLVRLAKANSHRQKKRRTLAPRYRLLAKRSLNYFRRFHKVPSFLRPFALLPVSDLFRFINSIDCLFFFHDSDLPSLFAFWVLDPRRSHRYRWSFDRSVCATSLFVCHFFYATFIILTRWLPSIYPITNIFLRGKSRSFHRSKYPTISKVSSQSVKLVYAWGCSRLEVYDFRKTNHARSKAFSVFKSNRIIHLFFGNTTIDRFSFTRWM